MTPPSDRIGLWFGGLFAVAATAPAAALLGRFGFVGWSRLVDFTSRHDLWHYTIALVVVLALPVLLIGAIALVWRRPRLVWPFATGVLLGIVTVCLLVPRWPNIVPAAGWWTLAAAGLLGLASVYLLVQRALR